MWMLLFAVLYSVVGLVFARACVPALWARSKAWHRTNQYGHAISTTEHDRREHVRDCALGRWVGWPIMIPIEFLTRRVDSTDPGALQRRIRELEVETEALRAAQDG